MSFPNSHWEHFLNTEFSFLRKKKKKTQTNKFASPTSPAPAHFFCLLFFLCQCFLKKSFIYSVTNLLPSNILQPLQLGFHPNHCIKVLLSRSLSSIALYLSSSSNLSASFDTFDDTRLFKTLFGLGVTSLFLGFFLSLRLLFHNPIWSLLYLLPKLFFFSDSTGSCTSS